MTDADRIKELEAALLPFADAIRRSGDGKTPADFLSFAHYHAAFKAIYGEVEKLTDQQIDEILAKHLKPHDRPHVERGLCWCSHWHGFKPPRKPGGAKT